MGAVIFWVVVLIIYGIYKAFEGSSSSSIPKVEKNKFNEERLAKFSDRNIDYSLTLFERNKDIIQNFADLVIDEIPPNNFSYRGSSSKSYYYLDDLTRDCINEICLAENNISARPNFSYLSNWENRASGEWVKLSEQIKKVFKSRQSELAQEKEVAIERRRMVELVQKIKIDKIAKEEKMVANEKKSLLLLKSYRIDPLLVQKITKTKKEADIYVDQIISVLTPNIVPWMEEERRIVESKKTSLTKYPSFEDKLQFVSTDSLNDEIAEFNKLVDLDIEAEKKNKYFFSRIHLGYKNKSKEDVEARVDFILNGLVFPDNFSKIWNVKYSPVENILIVEAMLPDVVHNQVYKEVQLKNGRTRKLLNQKERLEKIPQIHPAIILRIAYEIFRNDFSDTIKLLVINGWVEFDDPKTGNKTKTYTISLAVEKKQIIDLNLSKLDPLTAFTNLKGKSAGKLIDIIPVNPILSLDKKDKRFIQTKDVLNKLDNQTNLASMEWQEFENLIAELFQKEFSEEGTEIKLTQSSRDKGVDAVVFNPDPIRGGKYVIQAKRYTNTVDVSAVRDLVAVVAHEGASRGILVTTSSFGADAYAFVQGKPITLLDGAKLLGLLEKHGYKFRINLEEARKLKIETNNKASV